LELLEQKLDELLSSSDAITAAARYSVFSGGKRFRPQLTLAIGGPDALIPACAIELVHTYSLIHDDLPCMDNDDLRRGKLTLHKVYSEGHALLTGNFLLTYAFQLLAEAPLLSAHQKIELITILSRAVGAEGMIGGQAIDICNPILTLETLTDLHMKKTGALITAAVEFGGIVANYPDREVLRTLGKDLGILFQLLDDLADNDGAVNLLGREATLEQVNHYYENIQKSPFPQLAPLHLISK